MDESKDRRLKYLEISQVFTARASDVSISCKQSQRVCEKMAKQLATRKAKSPEDFERIEAMKDFVLKTSEANDKMLGLIDYMHGLLLDVAEDTKVLVEGAIIRDRLRDQSETIEILLQQREHAINELYDVKRSTNKGNPQ